MSFAETTQYYFVEEGAIVPPVEVWTGTRQVTNNPFYRPTRVSETFIGVNSSDAFLVDLGVYRLWVSTPTSPGAHYTLVTGPLVVVPGVRVERTDSWVAQQPETIREQHAAAAESQVREFTEKEIREEPQRKWQTDLDLRNRDAVLSALAVTEDADLDAFDPSFAAHPISDAQYAGNLVAQETEILVRDTELINAGAESVLSTQERADMQGRVQANRMTETGQGAVLDVPTKGAGRGLVTLPEEVTEQATFEEVSFDWNSTPYYIPEVRLPSMPEGVNDAQVYAMVYDADNSYRSWMPFEQQPDGTWRTPGGVSYISIAKQQSSSWRVAVAYQGTSADYEITQRVSLVPPVMSRSIIRWGGRGV